MDDFSVLVWLLSWVGIIFGGVSWLKTKRNAKTKLTLKQCKILVLVSVIISVVSFIGIGVTAPPVEETTNENTIISENTNNNEQNSTEETEAENNTTENNTESNAEEDFSEIKQQSLSNIPSYTNAAYVIINNNIPFFNDTDLVTNSYESYSNLDNRGRCGVAIANIGKDLMPTGERESIGSVKPTGWHTVKYDGIDGNYLYNRCHLIGYQLTAENANEKNLITGTRYMNVQGMLPFENIVADYIEETGNHVLYRVTPIFEGSNLLASGVLMEAKSVEDNGQGIQFNVYCYNVQPGITIDYATGESSGPEYAGSSSTITSSSSNRSTTDSSSSSTSTNTLPVTGNSTSNTSDSKSTSSNSSSSNNSEANNVETNTAETVTSNNEATTSYVLNTNTKKFHKPSCRYVDKISDANRSDYSGLRSSLISQGYEACKVCNP